MNGLPWQPADLDRLRQLAAEGASYRKMAATLHVSMNRIKSAMNKHRIFTGIHRGGRPRRANWAEIERLAKTMGVNEAARTVGINHSTALYIAKQRGFTFQRKVKPQTPPPKPCSREDAATVERLMRLALTTRRGMAA